jgi:DNA topoisomerase VI subunit B
MVKKQAKKAVKKAEPEVDTSAKVIDKVRKSAKQITTSSTAEYFAKNLQQVGFSSPVKAVLTTLKEALDNSLDACEDAGILPEIKLQVEKIGTGTLKNTDQIRILVEDNGPGIDPNDVAKVFGEYLASSKFGRGRCSRGQQGIGISAATTWAMQTTATGARVVTKTKGAKKAFSVTRRC